jgi:DNA-nicking Smr family endonuclease
MNDHKAGASRTKMLSALDLELWSAVTADVRPFRPRPIPPRPETPGAADARPASAVAGNRDAPSRPRPAPSPADIDGVTRKKLRRGRLAVDVKLDLHGMRQAEAHQALNGFLRRAQADGAKLAIIVTGKGMSRDGGGVLRRLAPLWLQAPALRDVVAAFGEAARQHGGEGALYVRLRAPKTA